MNAARIETSSIGLDATSRSPYSAENTAVISNSTASRSCRVVRCRSGSVSMEKLTSARTIGAWMPRLNARFSTILLAATHMRAHRCPDPAPCSCGRSASRRRPMSPDTFPRCG